MDASTFPSDPATSRRLRALTHGRGVARIATLPTLLDDVDLVHGHGSEPDIVLAWGRKPSALRAIDWAARRGLPVWTIEDGFLRSIGLGDAEPPLSLLVDDVGIYFDGSAPSRLEHLVNAADGAEAAPLIALWRASRASKYNHAREVPDALADGEVLVIDQTWGDASIRDGLAGPASFTRMLEAALDEHPASTIVLKVHPDVVAGRKRGHFDRLSGGAAARVRVLAGDAHPPGLLERAAAVYTVTSQIGFEALLWNRPLRTFGMPFYAGWGLSTDELPAPARRRPALLAALVEAALLRYPRYIDPETRRRGDAATLLRWIGWQRRQRERFPPQVHAIGFSRWKKPIVRAFLAGSRVHFARDAHGIPADATVAVWGRRATTDLPASARVLRIEDGFLRSVGLGADLVRPLSWVIDAQGLYYDATRRSGLEEVLATTNFSDEMCARARALRARILELGVTKYNVGAASWQRPAGVSEVVLVPGQVESDAALLLGSPQVRTNIGLLRAVRAMRPDAYVVYKPHPDVVAQLRRAGTQEHLADRYCNECVTDAPIDTLLKQVDEVHVMTSLAGFEALLRGRRVVTHGAPFYAGWGLTEDLLQHPRRGRQLSLEALIAGTLILYPTYVSRTSGHYAQAERALVELAEWRTREGPARASLPRRIWRTVLRWARHWSGGPA